MTDASSGAPVPKAAQLVAAQLRRQIVLGERSEGEMLPPESELTAELGVSRPTLRQALRILEAELLVTVLRGRNGGTRVNRPSPEVARRYLGNVLVFEGATLEDLHTARLLFEPAAVARLARTVTPEQIDRLTELTTEARRALELGEPHPVDTRFPTELVGMTRNPVAALFADLVHQLIEAHAIRRRPHAGTLPTLDATEAVTAQERLIVLLSAGAEIEAGRCWQAYLTAVHDRLTATVEAAGVIDLEV